MLKRILLTIALLALSVSASAAPQPYGITIRNSGAPATGLASQLNSAEAAYNPLTGASVTSPGVTWAEYGTSGRYYVSGGYDAAANGPLHINLDAGSTVTDPNERYAEIDLYADPANAAAVAGLLNTGRTAFSAPALANAPTGGGGSSLTPQQVANAVWDETVSAHTTTGTFAPLLGSLPSLTLAAIKSDSAFAKILNHVLEKYSYVPGTHTLTVKGDDGTTLGTVVISVDSSGNITSRQ